MQRTSSGFNLRSDIPNEKTVYVETHGCAANKFDLEIMFSYLSEAGYKLIDDPFRATLILMNTCGVKKPTEDRIIGKLRSISLLNKPLIITGCLPKINLNAIISAAPNFSVMMDPWSIDKMPLAIKSVENREKHKFFFSQKPIQKLKLPKMRFNPLIEIVLISEGCLGACAFCCVRLARTGFASFSKKSIADRVKQAVSEGAREIWLTSQDNGAYGLDINTNLAELLKECCRIEGQFMIRVGMMNPNHVLRMLPELVETYKNKKVFKFLHLPVQSGDNETLERMNRSYRVEEFKMIVDSFRREIPDITLSTDVICGFPGESRDAFEATLELMEQIQPDVVNVSRFFPRPRTKAEKMEQLDDQEVNYRSRKLTGLVRKLSFERNKRWLNWEGEIFVDERGKGFSWIGRNFAYKPIAIKSDSDLFGKFVRIRVVKAYPTYLEADVISES